MLDSFRRRIADARQHDELFLLHFCPRTLFEKSSATQAILLHRSTALLPHCGFFCHRS